MRIMNQFRIDELSAVDDPAQEHARVAIMKRDGAVPATPEGFAKAVAAIMARDRCLRSDAMVRAAHEHPEAVAALRKAAPAEAEEAEGPDEDERAGARRIFAAKVRELAARDQLGQASAMIRARAQHPDEFAAAYG